MPERLKTPAFLFVSLLILLLAFGLLAPALGLYFDDWPVISTIHLRSLSTFWDFYQGERPFSAWTYMLTAPFLGTTPLVWQFFSIFVRWLTVLGMWWCLKSLWPQRQREVTWMALIFAVYPAFDQQAISVAYSQHWMIYALYFLSLGAMIQSIRNPRRFWPWLIFSLAAMVVHIASMEYFAGLELLRPVILWLLAAESIAGIRERLKFTMKRWLPYLIVLVLFVIWRLFFLPVNGQDPNRPDLLYGFLSQPFGTLLELLQYAVQDSLNILFGSWYKTIDPNVYILSDRLFLFALGAGILSAIVAFIYLSRQWMGEDDAGDGESKDHWNRQALLLGFTALLLGPLPVWLTERGTTLGLYGSRFAIAGMFGAAILVVAALEWLTVRRLTRLALVCALIGLAVGFHVRRANDFRWSWTKQRGFYWQLYWRAPYLKPGTTLSSDGEIFLYVGRYSTSLALNLVYPQQLPYPKVAYWFYEITPERIRHPEEMIKGKPINFTFRNFQFSGSTRNSIIFQYDPEAGKCLWFLSPQDGDNTELNSYLTGALPLSNLNQVEPNPIPGTSPPTSIFGSEPEHNWCYYFEKADLARQLGQWDKVVELGDEAQKAGYTPNDAQEWIPFIQGYAMAGRWKEAIEWTEHVERVNGDYSPRLCNLWDRILKSTAPPDKFSQDFGKMQERLQCEASPQTVGSAGQ